MHIDANSWSSLDAGDDEGMLDGMATDELSMFVGAGVELQARAAALSRATRAPTCSLLPPFGRTPTPPAPNAYAPHLSSPP